MNKKPVKFSLNLAVLPPLNAKQKIELAALSAMPDSEIDFSDIPATTGKDWSSAVRGQFYRPLKQVTTVRVDSDVLLWLKSTGKGYQTRINAILREKMLNELHKV
ncbi:MAG: BrnA antitoxin family protein [Polaromonas sp.]